MTQKATVEAVQGPGIYLVAVVRESACGHDCGHCGGCGASPGSVTVRAEGGAGLVPGDRVEVESSNKVLLYAALVYLLPFALFLGGYALPLAGWGRALCGVLGFFLGVGTAMIADRRLRRKGGIRCRIVRKL